jgi:hypothetical protein
MRFAQADKKRPGTLPGRSSQDQQSEPTRSMFLSIFYA